jgi:multicomponent Na+:H+ antiporter subunit C
MGLVIMDYSVNLFLILIGYRLHGRAPISSQDQLISNMVDPLPQNMVLTTMVIGLGITAVLVAIAIRIFEKYKTFDITKINKLKG